MDADWSVEMGHDDEVLEFPWASDDPQIRFWDLRCHPESIVQIPEALDHPPLQTFLAALNSTETCFQTAKCDVWQSHLESGDRANSDASCVASCYVDLLFTDVQRQASFAAHESLVRSLSRRVQAEAEIKGEVEFIVRRCFYHRVVCDMDQGCYITCYVHGFGVDERTAGDNWASALALVQHTLRAFSENPSL